MFCFCFYFPMTETTVGLGDFLQAVDRCSFEVDADL